MHKRTRRVRIRKVEVSQELELMPMLNVFISIIPLLLLSAAFVQLAVIPTALPGQANAPAAATRQEPELSLTIVIHEDSYAVQANGVVAQAIARTPVPATASGEAATNPARTQLQEVLTTLAAEHPGHRTVRIVADPTTHYEEIIDVMDVSRAAGLPDAALADAE